MSHARLRAQSCVASHPAVSHLALHRAACAWRGIAHSAAPHRLASNIASRRVCVRVRVCVAVTWYV
jgi:hypothetical protein